MDAARYTVAYHLADIDWLVAAAFTEGGDTLFAVGTSELISVAAATGAVIARAPHDYFPWSRSSTTSAVVADRARPWLYVVGWADGYTPVPFLDVHERSSLARVARLKVQAWAAPSVPSINATRGDWTLLASPVERRPYATVTDWGNISRGSQATAGRLPG